jgi:hypothetical protein
MTDRVAAPWQVDIFPTEPGSAVTLASAERGGAFCGTVIWLTQTRCRGCGKATSQPIANKFINPRDRAF